LNDFLYRPGDQRVIFLWHEEEDLRRRTLHRFLSPMLKGCVQAGKQYEAAVRTYHLMRMVAGFNIGELAGQSVPHFHMQYGWEAALDGRSISQEELGLYFEELPYSDLIIFQNRRIRVVAPWTPKGQFALELYFRGKYDPLEIDETDLRLFACMGPSHN
jgi:hypothetical protein